MSQAEKRITELELRRREIAEDQRLELLGERLRRIRQGMKKTKEGGQTH